MSDWSNHTKEILFEMVGDGDSAEFFATISFKYHPGSPEVGPTYSHGGLPADGAEIDAVKVVALVADFGGDKTRKRDFPLVPELCEWIERTVSREELIEVAQEDREVERDSAADARYQEMRDEGMA